MTGTVRATVETLNFLVEFDCPFRVNSNGTVTTYLPNVWAPEVIDDEIGSDDWTFVNGFSGQYGYGGPHMHASEYLGGRMARHVLSTPGVYVLVAPWTDDDETEELVPSESWVLLYRESE